MRHIIDYYNYESVLPVAMTLYTKKKNNPKRLSKVIKLFYTSVSLAMVVFYLHNAFYDISDFIVSLLLLNFRLTFAKNNCGYGNLVIRRVKFRSPKKKRGNGKSPSNERVTFMSE